VTFDVDLDTVVPSDVLPASLTTWHSPSVCPGPVYDLASAARLGLALNVLCVSNPCDGHRCNLTVALPQARQYALKVFLFCFGVFGPHCLSPTGLPSEPLGREGEVMPPPRAPAWRRKQPCCFYCTFDFFDALDGVGSRQAVEHDK
jgi:hypothetical protein